MKITRSNDLEWISAIEHGSFSQKRKPLGGERLTAGLWQLAPGKRSFPLHAHAVTEEAMFVVSGQAKVRTPDGETPIGPGDYVSFPAGGLAHQLVNDGAEPLVYLALSAIQGFDGVEYPDSGKIALTLGAYPTGKRFLFKKDNQVDYFDGEE